MAASDIEVAIAGLEGHALSLARNGERLISDKRGISAMMEYIAVGEDLNGFAVADIIVGKAAAMLFVKAGIKEVYARTLSLGGKETLERYGIKYSYSHITDRIINRRGDGACPMESAVKDIDDAEEGYIALKNAFFKICG